MRTRGTNGSTTAQVPRPQRMMMLAPCIRWSGVSSTGPHRIGRDRAHPLVATPSLVGHNRIRLSDEATAPGAAGSQLSPANRCDRRASPTNTTSPGAPRGCLSCPGRFGGSRSRLPLRWRGDGRPDALPGLVKIEPRRPHKLATGAAHRSSPDPEYAPSHVYLVWRATLLSVERRLSAVDRPRTASGLAWPARPPGMGRDLGHYRSAD